MQIGPLPAWQIARGSFICVLGVARAAAEHPFLNGFADDAKLQARTSRSPWHEIRSGEALIGLYATS